VRRKASEQYIGDLESPAGIIIAYSVSPLIPYADPLHFAAVGIFAASAVYTRHTAATSNGPLSKLMFAVAACCLLTAGYMSIRVTSEIKHNYSANSRRCLAIQTDMLAAMPRRTDDPDMFQALGCRPLGEGSVYASPRKR